MSSESQSIRRRIIAVLLSASLLPLFVLGVGAWVVFGRLFDRESVNLMESIVQDHSRFIDSYLTERANLLRLLAETHTLEQITTPGRLEVLLDILNQSSSGGFVDLGVIAADGRHLAYVGPYNLQDRNYREAQWFKELTLKTEFISDVFLGFRGVPHCIVAIKVINSGPPWILRGTINSEQFGYLVKPGLLGETGDVFIVNKEGIYQTIAKSSAILERSNVEIQEHTGLREYRIKSAKGDKIRITSWVNQGRWMLVVEQNKSAAQWPLHRAIFTGALVLLLAVFLLVATTIAATSHLTRIIDRTSAQREEFHRAFTRSSKLASIGEMATGIAHEINNPLAIISSEQTNISDLIGVLPEDTPGRTEALDSVKRSQRQVQRCAGITRKMLQFGRKTETSIEPTDITPRLKEIISLMSKQAQIRNVDLVLNLETNLPKALIDPLELEQVIVNLINNALDAIKRGGKIEIKAQRQGDYIHLAVCDSGPGMPPGVQERIFEPFFTTKPVGRGTGLGLSVCFGMVTGWGGKIECESAPGRGTTMHLQLPVAPI